MLGGGVVGVELGQAWDSLGAQVTIVEGGPRLIAREEEFASQLVHEALSERGIEIHTGSRATSVRRQNGTVTVELENGESVEGTELLAAIGRRPNTSDLGVDRLGLEPGKPIEVDDSMRANEWLYAIGDANGRALLTHVGKYQGRIAADVILGKDAHVDPLADGPLTPRVIFTDPNVAAVGHTLASAKEAGIEARAVDHPTSGVAGGSFYGREAPGRRGSSSTSSGACSPARPSAAPRSQSGCTPRRSPSSPKCRSTSSGTPSPRSPRETRSGCACSRRTGSRESAGRLFVRLAMARALVVAGVALHAGRREDERVDITIEELEADPHPALARLRAEEPVAWVPALGAWLVTRRDLALAAMRDAEGFTVDDPRFSTAQVVGRACSRVDGAEHGRHRDPFARPSGSTRYGGGSARSS